MARGFIGLALAAMLSAVAPARAAPLEQRLHRLVTDGMRQAGSQGLAIAVIDGGKVRLVRSWGKRNEKGEPLTIDTVMYGASQTKMRADRLSVAMGIWAEALGQALAVRRRAAPRRASPACRRGRQ